MKGALASGVPRQSLNGGRVEICTLSVLLVVDEGSRSGSTSIKIQP